MAPKVRLSEALLAQVLDRLCRFHHYLSRLELASSKAEVLLVRLFEHFLSQIRDGLAEKLFPRMVPGGGRAFSENARIRALLLAATQLDTLLLGTQVFPRGRPFPQTYTFVEHAFPFVPQLRDRLAVVLWPDYNFAEEDFRESLQEALKLRDEGAASNAGQRQITLYLTEAEAANPSMWCILGHEMGHALEEEHTLGERAWNSLQFRSTDRAAWEMLYVREWVRELIADEIALRVLGPAYFCAFAFLSLTESSPLTLDRTHPPSWTRVQRLYALIDEKGSDETVQGYYELLKLRVAHDRRHGIDELELSSITWDDIFASVSHEADTVFAGASLSPPEHYWKTGAALASSLHDGLPISTTPPADLDQLHERAVDLRRRSASRGPRGHRNNLAQEFQDLKTSFNDIPNHPLAVLSAAWVDGLQSITGRCSKLLAGLPDFSDQARWATETERRTLAWGDDAAYRDRLLLKSLEISSFLVARSQ